MEQEKNFELSINGDGKTMLSKEASILLSKLLDQLSNDGIKIRLSNTVRHGSTYEESKKHFNF